MFPTNRLFNVSRRQKRLSYRLSRRAQVLIQRNRWSHEAGRMLIASDYHTAISWLLRMSVAVYFRILLWRVRSF